MMTCSFDWSGLEEQVVARETATAVTVAVTDIPSGEEADISVLGEPASSRFAEV
jgi:hypothetical protein